MRECDRNNRGIIAYSTTFSPLFLKPSLYPEVMFLIQMGCLVNIPLCFRMPAVLVSLGCYSKIPQAQLTHRHFSHMVLEAGKSKLNVPAGSALAGDPFLALRWLPPCCALMVERKRESSVLSLFLQGH